MVTITKTKTETTFEIKGLHKLWALKSEIKIPNKHIVKAHQNESKIKDWNLNKLIGTNMPYVLNAGTFYKNNGLIFMDVAKKHNAIIVDLVDEKYKQLIIEVEEPTDAINLINSPI